MWRSFNQQHSQLITVSLCFVTAVSFLRWLPLPLANGHLASLPSICLFHNWTGLPCPLCGMTRSLVCSLHGYWSEAIYWHPLGPFVLLFSLVWLALQWIQALHLRQISRPRFFSNRTLYLTGFCIVIAIWFARLLHFVPTPSLL